MSALYYVNSGYWDVGYAEGEGDSSELLISAALSVTTSPVVLAATALDVAASVAATAAYTRVRPTSLNVICVGTASSDVLHVKHGNMLSTPTLSSVAEFVRDRNVGAQASTLLTAVVRPERLLKVIAFTSTSAMVSVNGRLKWELGAPTDEEWVGVAPSESIWALQEVADEEWVSVAPSESIWTLQEVAPEVWVPAKG